MSVTPEYSNRLLRALPERDLDLLRPHLAKVDLELEDDLETPGGRVEQIYFIESGIASTVTDANHMARSHPVEIGLIGREGVTGVSIILGADASSHSIYMQVAGNAVRIEADQLRSAIDKSRSLQSVLLKYVKVFISQISETALANGRSKIEQRLARWVLMADDRLDEAELPLRHDFLAMMLAVRRPGVTEAIHALEGRGLIKNSRGHLRVMDRDGLVEEADGCYGAPEAEYRLLIENDGGASGLNKRQFKFRKETAGNPA
jgi:CRP-like cAMP-binding protein